MNTETTVAPAAQATNAHHRVVVGYDGSDSSIAAVEWATSEAAARNSVLRVVTCSAVPESVDYYGIGARQNLGLTAVVTAIRERLAHLTVEQASTPLDPRDALIDAASDADLLVVGSSESGMAKAWLLGSVPRTATRRSPCPVIVVRAERQHPPHRIVVGVDSSRASAAALDWAADEAECHGAEIVIIHAWQRPGDAGHSSRTSHLTRADAQCLLDLAVNRCRARTSRVVSGTLIEGPAAAVLTEASGTAGLVVVGSRGRSGFRTMLFGSVALFVTDNARCPVAVCHPGLWSRNP